MGKRLQADPRARAWTLALFAATTVVGGAAVFLSSRAVDSSRTAGRLPEAAVDSTLGRLALTAWALTWCVTALTVLAAYLMVRLAVFSLRTGTFPPPGTRTLRPVPVLTGTQATRRAVGGMVFAALLLGFAAFLPILMTALARRLLVG